ncbi:MAG: hypothetical protein HYY37_04185 [Candidatus Aenigmarchaeota archaeon]|nr:hypothetical protein [Candidatus Aenigmarchaeota archaeon]
MSITTVSRSDINTIGYLNRNRVRIRNPAVVGVGLSPDAAQSDAAERIQHYARRGNYQYVVLGNCLVLPNSDV